MIKTINLEASVEWTKSKLRDLLDDPADLFAQLDAVVVVSHLSASEGKQAGIAAIDALVNCVREAEANGASDCAEKIGNVVSTLSNDLRIWSDESYRNELAARKLWCDPNIRDACVARWESRGGAHWVELWHGPYDFHYVSGNSCGSVCNPSFPVESAVLVMASRLARGQFLPDKAKLPMKRVS